jgi:hypothetical protein
VLHALQSIGLAERSPYHNVLVMKLEDSVAVLETVERLMDERPDLYEAIAWVAPTMSAFEFASSERFITGGESHHAGMVADVGRTNLPCTPAPAWIKA